MTYLTFLGYTIIVWALLIHRPIEYTCWLLHFTIIKGAHYSDRRLFLIFQLALDGLLAIHVNIQRPRRILGKTRLPARLQNSMNPLALLPLNTNYFGSRNLKLIWLSVICSISSNPFSSFLIHLTYVTGHLRSIVGIFCQFSTSLLVSITYRLLFLSTKYILLYLNSSALMSQSFFYPYHLLNYDWFFVWPECIIMR